jgi:hypothetical protein
MGLEAMTPAQRSQSFRAHATVADGEKEDARHVPGVAETVRAEIAGTESLLRVLRRHGAPHERAIAEKWLRDLGIDVDHDTAPRGLPPALLPSSVLLDTSYPPPPFVCRPYVPRGEVTEIVGPHGAYKSTIALDLALAVSSGRPWGGAAVARGRAVFITLEDREDVIALRVKAYLAGIDAGQERSAAEKLIRASFTFLGREQARPLALTSTDRAGTVVREDVVGHLAAIVKGADLLVLETSTKLHAGGPETNEALAVLASAVERIATETGAAVVIVRHVPKSTARETEREPDSYWGRGGGSFSDAARSVVAVRIDPAKEGDAPDAFAPVRAFHTKAPPFARRGETLAWKPTLVDLHSPDGPIYLRGIGRAEQTADAAERLLRHLCALPNGLTKTDLQGKKGKPPPAGLPRGIAKEAMEHLVTQGRATVAQEKRGQKNVPATVYRPVDSGA